MIQYEKPSCGPLPVPEGKWILKISPDGLLCTSTRPQEGWARDQYVWVSSSAERRKLDIAAPGGDGMIRNHSHGTCSALGAPGASYEKFFVGTEKDLSASSGPPVLGDCQAGSAG